MFATILNILSKALIVSMSVLALVCFAMLMYMTAVSAPVYLQVVCVLLVSEVFYVAYSMMRSTY